MAPAAKQFLVLLLFASAAAAAVHGCGLTIQNSCGFPVTACAQSGSDNIAQYQLGAGGSQFLDFGGACKWPAGAVWASVGGHCGDGNVARDRNLANLAEATIGASATDFYDLSNVNAYTIGLRIQDVSGRGCHIVTCVINDIRSFCQGDNQLISLPTGALSCINTDGTHNVNAPTPNTEMFKNACPDSYSWPHDDATSLFTCPTGSNYEVTFCPSGQLAVE